MHRLILIAFLFMVGCPGPAPTPPTSHECFADPDIRQSCSTCASTPVCAWCASEDPQRRGCYPRDEPFDCDGEVVRVSDLCSELESPLNQPIEASIRPW